MGKGYRCSPFLKAHLKICLLMAVIILENSSPVASETERAERASTDLRGLGKAHDRQKCFPTLISPFCQITPCVDMRVARWLWEVFSQNNVYSILGAELRKKTSVTIKEFSLGIHRNFCFLKKKKWHLCFFFQIINVIMAHRKLHKLQKSSMKNVKNIIISLSKDSHY